MKGRIALVFWLVVVLAVLTATASYAWLAINASSGLGGIEIEAIADSVYLEISADPDADYDTSVSFDPVSVYGLRSPADDRLPFITYETIPQRGASRITVDLQTTGVYNGTGHYYEKVKSDMSDPAEGYACYSYIDVTNTLTPGQSLAGLYTVVRNSWYAVSDTSILDYYYEHERNDGTIVDYVCIGKIPVGETLSGRVIWGYAESNDLEDPQKDNAINVISLDFPPSEYRLHQTVYLRCAEGTGDGKNLRIDSVEIEGRSYLEDTIRIMFVATSDNGETVTKFYSRRDIFAPIPLFANVFGNTEEIVKVDMYVFFDGADPDAYDQGGAFTNSDVTVKFAIDDYIYN